MLPPDFTTSPRVATSFPVFSEARRLYDWFHGIPGRPRLRPGYRARIGRRLYPGVELAERNSKTALLTVTQFTASTSARAGGPLNISLRVANTGDLDAGAFQIRILFTSDGTQATANDFVMFCDAKGLASGATFTCAGTINMGGE